MKYFYFFSLLFSLITLLPLIRRDDWWLRIFEFPRAQILLLGIVLIIFSLFIFDHQNVFFLVTFTVIIIFALYQASKILPYTMVYPKQMVTYQGDNLDSHIRLMISNVLMTNKNIAGLVKLVQSHDPDILLVVEVNSRWHEALNSELVFKHVVAKPLDNTYGMVLYSNYEISEYKIDFLVEDEVPSIHAEITLPSGQNVFLYCLHPKPPAPQESTETTERDAELLLVGKIVKAHGGPAIVTGDLNDVAWSYTTTLFQKISGLLDPRIGRGMFNTFHSKIPILRYPLDHAFASKHFELVSMQRLSNFGSDHFPIFLELSLKDNIPVQNDVPDADQADKVKAENKIQEALD